MWTILFAESSRGAVWQKHQIQGENKWNIGKRSSLWAAGTWPERSGLLVSPGKSHDQNGLANWLVSPGMSHDQYWCLLVSHMTSTGVSWYVTWPVLVSPGKSHDQYWCLLVSHTWNVKALQGKLHKMLVKIKWNHFPSIVGRQANDNA